MNCRIAKFVTMQLHYDYCACKTATHIVISISMPKCCRNGVSCSASYCQPLAYWARGGSFERSFDRPFEKADVRLRGS